MEGRIGEARLPPLLTVVLRRIARNRAPVRVLCKTRRSRYAGTWWAEDFARRSTAHNSLETRFEYKKSQGRLHHVKSPTASGRLGRNGWRSPSPLLSSNSANFKYL